MIGVAAANNGKAKEAADLAAELVHMGWGVLVSHILTRTSYVSGRRVVPAFCACVLSWQMQCPALE